MCRMNSESSVSDEGQVQQVLTEPEEESLIDEDMACELYGPDPEGMWRATHYFCELLIEGPDSARDELVKSGIIPRFVELVQMTDQPKLQAHAVWVLSGIACGTEHHTRKLIESGAVPALIKLLEFPSEIVQTEALRGLGNIAEGSTGGRNLMLSEGFLAPLIHILTSANDLSLLRVTIEALCKVCLDASPLPDFGHLVQNVLPVLGRLYFHSDPKVLADSCWAVIFLCRQPDQATIQAVIAAGITPQLVTLLWHDNEDVVCGSLGALGCVLTGTNSQKQAVIDSGVLIPLENLLTRMNVTDCVRREACSTLANITAGNPSQIQLVIDAGFIPILIETLRSSDFKTQEKAAFAVTNALCGGTQEQIEMFVQCGCIPPLCDLLDSRDKWMLGLVHFSLKAILQWGASNPDDQGFSSTALTVMASHGLEKLDALKEHEDPTTSRMAVQLVAEYFAHICFEITLS